MFLVFPSFLGFLLKLLISFATVPIMNLIKSVLFTLLFLIAAITGYTYFKFDSKYAKKMAAAAYIKKDYTTAEQYLSVLNQKKDPKYVLYKVYIDRSLGRFEEAAKGIANLEKSCEDQDLKQEIEFNRYLNAYTEKNFENLDLLLTRRCNDSSIYHLFKGLSDYQKRLYSNAKEHFLKSKTVFMTSAFMEEDWNSFFNETELTYILSHCMIESDQPYYGRQKMESSLSKSELSKPRFSYLFGLSFFREGESKPIASAITSYEMAFMHFKRIPLWDDQYHPYKEEIRHYYEHLMTQLLQESCYKELGSFLDALEFLGSNVDQVATLFLEHIKKEVCSNDEIQLRSLARQTLAYCHHSLFRDKISESLQFYIQNLIEQQDLKSIKQIWPIYYQISSSPEEDKEAISKFILEKLNQTIELDDSSLEKSSILLEIISFLDLSSEKKIGVLDALTPLIQEIWIQSSEKALSFTKAIDQYLFNNSKDVYQQKMDEVLDLLQSKKKSKKAPIEEVNPILKNESP